MEKRGFFFVSDRRGQVYRSTPAVKSGGGLTRIYLMIDETAVID